MSKTKTRKNRYTIQAHFNKTKPDDLVVITSMEKLLENQPNKKTILGNAILLYCEQNQPEYLKLYQDSYRDLVTSMTAKVNTSYDIMLDFIKEVRLGGGITQQQVTNTMQHIQDSKTELDAIQESAAKQFTGFVCEEEDED